MTYGDFRRGRDALPEPSFEIEQARDEAGRIVRDEYGLRRIKDLDCVDCSEKDSLTIPDELRDTDARELPTTNVTRIVCTD
jgi:hypothetical protein